MDNSGSAFPSHEHFFSGNKVITGKPYGGLTKREYFAGIALQGILISNNTYPIYSSLCTSLADIVKTSYALADDMLSESKKEGTND